MSKAMQMYQVLIEWDGEQPPSTWYSRLHKLAGKVRGDKDLSPMQRREDQGLVFQEGAILCQSEWLARTLATYAKHEFEARSVAIATVTIQHDFVATKADWDILKRLQSQLGKRGPKPKEEVWSVTCLEEMRVSQEVTAQPIQCPHCHSTRILARKGGVVLYRYDGGNVVEFWIKTRFSGSHWEPCAISNSDAAISPPLVTDLNMTSSDELLSNLLLGSGIDALPLPLDEALEVLDAIYVSRRYLEPERRKRARVEAVAKFFEAGGDPAKARLNEGPVPDIFDAAPMLGTSIGLVYKQLLDRN